MLIFKKEIKKDYEIKDEKFLSSNLVYISVHKDKRKDIDFKDCVGEDNKKNIFVSFCLIVPKTTEHKKHKINVYVFICTSYSV